MMRPLLFSICVLFAATACGQATPVKDDNAAAEKAAAVTSEYHLTQIKTDCLFFDTADEGKDWLVRVRENHSKECGGFPESEPTIFYLKIRKSDGHTTTNAYSSQGQYEELRATPAHSSSSGR